MLPDDEVHVAMRAHREDTVVPTTTPRYRGEDGYSMWSHSKWIERPPRHECREYIAIPIKFTGAPMNGFRLAAERTQRS
jgi:hypothetical protein